MENPCISVVMPVYNAEKYLSQAITSILEQTYSNFELLILDDGSSDKSLEIASSFKDKRIRIVSFTANQGLVAMLNFGIQESKGSFIAIMHSDDIALPTRLEKQINFLNQNKELSACGSFIEVISTNKKENDYSITISDSETAKLFLLFDNPICHPSVMFRKEALNKFNLLYNKDYFPAEDYKMWVTLSQISEIGNVPEVLLKYRLHDTQITSKFNNKLVEKRRLIIKEQLQNLGINPSIYELKLHDSLFLNFIIRSTFYEFALKTWAEKLKKSNAQKKIYNTDKFNLFIDGLYKKKKIQIRSMIKDFTMKQKIVYYLKKFTNISVVKSTY